MDNHQLTKTGSKIASHLLAVIAGLILVMIGLLLSVPMVGLPRHSDRPGWSAHLSLGAVRKNHTEARDSAARVSGRG